MPSPMEMLGFPQQQQAPLQPQEPPEEESEFSRMPWYHKALDLLARLGYSSAGAAHAMVSGGNVLEGAWKGFSGQERRSYSDVLGAVGFDSGMTRAVLGFGLDVALDPLSYTTFGAGKGAGKIAVGGVEKTLTQAGQAARVLSEGEKSAQALRVLNRLDVDGRVAVKGHLLERYGTGGMSELPNEALAKMLGEKITAEGFGRFAEGKPISGVLGEHLQGRPPGRTIPSMGAVPIGADPIEWLTSYMKGTPGLKPQQVFESPTLRLMGAPLIPAETMGAGLEKLKAGYSALEGVKGVGPVLKGVREGGGDVLKWMKGLFSTDTGDPWLNETVTKYRDKLDFDTTRLFNTYSKELGPELFKLRKTDPIRAKTVQDQILGALEGVKDIQYREIPHVEKIRLVDSKLDLLRGELKQTYAAGEKTLKAHGGAIEAAEAAIKGKGQEYAQAVGEHRKAIGQAAETEATRQTKELQAAHAQQYGDLEREMRKTGIAPIPGIAGEEYRANIPKQYRKAKGLPMDEWIDQLKGGPNPVLGPHAREAEFYDLIAAIRSKPGKVAPEAVKAGVQAPKEAARLKEIEGQVAALRKEKAALEAKVNPAAVDLAKAKGLEKKIALLEGKKAEYAAKPPTRMEPYGVSREPTEPLAKELAGKLRGRLENVYQAEQKLPLPPEHREGYFPHVMKDDINPAIRKLIRQDSYKVLTREYSGSLTSSQRRTYQGLVDELTVGKLIDEGKIDKDLLEKELKRQGIKFTPDETLFFENDPIAAVWKRELKSIRALNHADMTREILASPHFVKAKVQLKDAEEIKDLLARNPGYSAFIPTKDYIEKFLTPAERESLRSGARPELHQSFIKDVSDILAKAKDQIEGKPERMMADAYILRNEAAAHLSKALAPMSDEATRNFLKIFDRFTAYFKTFQTLPNPRFYLRNAVSYVWQAGVLAGANNPVTWQKSILALRKPEAVANFGKFTAKEAVDIAERNGIVRGGFIGREIGEAINRVIDPSKNPLSLSGPIARKGGELVQSIDNVARFALFTDGLEKGMDVQSAIARSKKYLFDYNDLTKFEKQVMRRVIPFYTWSRKSIPLAFEAMLTQPGKVAAIPKIQHEAEANVEGSLDNKDVAHWIRDLMGVPIRKNADGKIEYFLMGTWIPTMDIRQLDPREMLSMTHPAIKIPLEQWMNQNIYTGKPLERFPGELQKVAGVPMTGRLANVIRNIGFVQQFDKEFFRDDVDLVRTPLAVLGISTYAQDKVRQMTAKENDLNHEMGQMKGLEAQAREKYGDDSSISQQYAQRLANITLERDKIKQDLQDIGPQARQMKPRQQERPMAGPATKLMRQVARAGKPRMFSPKIQKILSGKAARG